MLTVVVLRRMAAEAATVEQLVPDDAWNRLRARIERSRRRARAQAWQWRATLGGMATATMLVAVLIGPAAVHVTDRTSLETDAASIARLTDRVETQLEEARLNNLRKNSAGSSARTIDGAQTAGSVPRWHPAEDEGGALSPITIVAPTSRPTGFHPI
jgi:hypothetical protein